MNGKELSNISTKTLCDELERREAVQRIAVSQYEPFEIIVDGKSQPTEIKNLGSCLIYVVWD